MNISFETIINTIFYIGAIQGFILTIFLFNVKTNILSNRLLGILTSLWAVLLLVFALQSYGLYVHYPHLLKVFFLLLFVWFPLLYLSVKYLIFNYNAFQKADFLHFVPMVIVALLFMGFYLKSAEEKIEIARAREGFYYIATIISEEILSIQGVVYTIMCLMMVFSYKRNIVDYQSTIDSKVLNGIRNGSSLALFAWIVGIVATQLERLDIDIGIDLFLIVYLTFVVIIYLISIVAIRSPEVFKLNESEAKSLLKSKKRDSLRGEKIDSDNYGNIGAEKKLDEKENENILQQLNLFMSEKRPFLNPDLSLQELARQFDVSRHQLSAAINSNQEMNFYVFVNKYRINEVKSLMQNPDYNDQNNYELAYEAGFNSKASFYRIFKQFTNQTPSEFRAKLS